MPERIFGLESLLKSLTKESSKSPQATCWNLSTAWYRQSPKGQANSIFSPPSTPRSFVHTVTDDPTNRSIDLSSFRSKISYTLSYTFGHTFSHTFSLYVQSQLPLRQRRASSAHVTHRIESAAAYRHFWFCLQSLECSVITQLADATSRICLSVSLVKHRAESIALDSELVKEF